MDYILAILLVLLVSRSFIKDKETFTVLKKLNGRQLLGIAVTFIFTIIIATSLIYYGGNWIVGQFSNIFVKAIVFTLIVGIVLYLTINGSNKVLSKITDGALPKS